MWNNSQWEQENQELLKEWYLDKVTGKPRTRRCGRSTARGVGASSTRESTPSGTATAGAPSWATGSIRGRDGLRRGRTGCAPYAGRSSPPPGLTPSTAPTPAARAHTASVLRLKQVSKLVTYHSRNRAMGRYR